AKGRLPYLLSSAVVEALGAPCAARNLDNQGGPRMIVVFVRSYPPKDKESKGAALRFFLGMAVLARIADMPGIRVRMCYPLPGAPSLEAHDIAVPPPFHINSKKLAEERAASPIYCVMDDDQLPLADDFFSLGAATLAAHPDYGLLSGFPLEYGLHGQPYATRTEEVIEAHSIGCPYFVRKGTLSFPEGSLRQYDGILSKVVTDQGLKTGF